MFRDVEISGGRFPEIEKYNPNFELGRNKLKLRIDFEDSGHLQDYDMRLNRMLTRHFPGVSRHWCGVDGGDDFQSKPEVDFAMPVHLAHLMEHLMLDLQCRMGVAAPLSGITCTVDRDSMRSDIYVECPDERKGWIAAVGILYLMKSMTLEEYDDDWIDEFLASLVSFCDTDGDLELSMDQAYEVGEFLG